jgi:hypothetical protein
VDCEPLASNTDGCLGAKPIAGTPLLNISKLADLDADESFGENSDGLVKLQQDETLATRTSRGTGTAHDAKRAGVSG